VESQSSEVAKGEPQPPKAKDGENGIILTPAISDAQNDPTNDLGTEPLNKEEQEAESMLALMDEIKNA